MEMETSGVIEWTIENFSYWNGKIHSTGIESPESLPHEHRITFHLFPKGLSGNDERLEVNVFSDQLGSFSGELSFIAPDGSLLYKLQVNLEKTDRILKLPPGPVFQKVVTQIRKCEVLHQDRLTLRLRLKNPSGYASLEYMRTSIDAYDAFFKISPHILKPSNSLNSKISWIYYPLDEAGSGLMTLVCSRDRMDYSKIELALDPHSLEKKVCVFTRMTVFKSEGDVVRVEDNEHLFREKVKWTFSRSLKDDEVEMAGFSAIIKVKIVPCNSYKNSVGLSSFCSQAVDPIPLKELIPRHQSVPPEAHSDSPSDAASHQQHDNALEDLFRQMKCLFKEQSFSDFRLKCENVTFPVHRAILGVRSPVLKTIISEAASEKIVEVPDMDANTLKRFLSFLYTGTVEDLHVDSSLKLYLAADKYQVPALKKECVNFLCANVCISNVCDVLPLAVRHQDQKLTSAALKFVLGNRNQVLESRQWKTFMKREPLLVAQTMTLLADKKHQYNKEKDSY